jgi:chromosome partitioning protein
MAPVRTIAVTNQKGGVGKTTTVANLGSALAKRGKKVALIDLDPQANLTMSLGVDPSAVTHSVYSVLTGGEPLSQAAVMVEENLTLFPAVIDLAAAEVELAAEVGREHILLGRFNAEPLPYDLLLIDCPPSLGLLTLNALAAVEEVLIPLQPHFLALQGLGRLLETVELVHDRINPRLSVSGVIFCMYESATKLANEVVDDVCKFFEAARGQGKPWSAGRVFQTRIRRNIKLAESPSFGASILKYEPLSNGAKDYTALAEEFLGECAVPEAPPQTTPAQSETAVQSQEPAAG